MFNHQDYARWLARFTSRFNLGYLPLGLIFGWGLRIIPALYVLGLVTSYIQSSDGQTLIAFAQGGDWLGLVEHLLRGLLTWLAENGQAIWDTIVLWVTRLGKVIFEFSNRMSGV